MRKYYLLLGCVIASFLVSAQSQWKFHIALEDSTGAKDTLWAVWHPGATTGIDSLLGERYIFEEDSGFYCYIKMPFDHSIRTEVIAYPYWADFSFSCECRNETAPVFISWDSSLFSTGLPVPYDRVYYARLFGTAIFFDNLPYGFDMLKDIRYLLKEIGPYSISPFSIGISSNIINSVPKNNTQDQFSIINPVIDILQIISLNEIYCVSIFSLSGEQLLNIEGSNCRKCSFSEVSLLPAGIYIIRINDAYKQPYYEKIIKL